MFEYNGNIPQVRDAVEENSEGLTRAYRELLGERFETLREMYRRLAPTKSLDSRLEFEILGNSGGITPDPDNSYFHITCDFDYDITIYPSGKVGKNRVTMRPLISISDNTIELASQSEKYRGLPKYLIPYVHEFNHFVLFCFQPIPDALAGIIGWMKAEEYGEMNRQDLTKYVDSRQLPWVRIFAQHHIISETTQDFLTSQVLSHLGYSGNQIIDFPFIKESLTRFQVRDIKTLFDFSDNWYKRVKPFDNFQEIFFKTLSNIQITKEAFE